MQVRRSIGEDRVTTNTIGNSRRCDLHTISAVEGDNIAVRGLGAADRIEHRAAARKAYTISGVT